MLRVGGVLEAAVVGRADADGLVRPPADGTLKPDRAESSPLEDELQAFARNVAGYKVPSWVAIVAELPKTATGKIQRFRLRGG
jgi:4-hydroxybenzoate-CoA ligase/benzoate-CoA ligase